MSNLFRFELTLFYKHTQKLILRLYKVKKRNLLYILGFFGYPRLFNATNEQLNKWEILGGGYGIHWSELDEDLSTEGLLRGARHRKHFPSSLNPER